MSRTTCAALLAAALLLAPAARAEICLDFETDDGLEITIEGDLITGWWRNVDGEGKDIPIHGIVRDGLPLPCTPGRSTARADPQNPAKAGIACIWDEGCEGLFAGWDWYVILDGLDGSLDIGYDVGEVIGPPGACGLDDLAYTVLLGPCPFGPDGKGAGSGITLQQAIRARAERE